MSGFSDREQQLFMELLPDVRAAYSRYRAECRTKEIMCRLTETYRPQKKQAEHHAAGRSTLSVGWHQLRRALHEVIFVDGVADMNGKHIDLWRKRARIAEAHGFRQLGFKPDGSKKYVGKNWDVYHLEYRSPHETLVAAVEAEAPELRAMMD